MEIIQLKSDIIKNINFCMIKWECSNCENQNIDLFNKNPLIGKCPNCNNFTLIYYKS